MDASRSQRFGKPYYRTAYMPPTARQALEDRLHLPGISTSSNSSWTFSNSHCDIPKPRKGKLCGIFLIGAVLVVALAVIAIAGLAFYIGGHTTEKHRLSEYQNQEHVGVNRQYLTTQKPLARHTSKITERTVKPSSTESSTQTKTIPILGLSETMQQFNKESKNRKKEEVLATFAPDIEDITEENLTEKVEDSPIYITENIEIVPENNQEEQVVHNGHARPTFAVETSTMSITGGPIPPRRDYSDEPWRPIIPVYRDTARIKSPTYRDEGYRDKVFAHRHGPLVEPVIENDSPITFSRESYEQNLRITPEFAGANSRISEEIAVKHGDLVKDRLTEVVLTSDDTVTAPPSKPAPSDVIIVKDLSTLSTLSTAYNATERPKIVRPAVGVDQILSEVSLIESNLNPPTTLVTIPISTSSAIPLPTRNLTTARAETKPTVTATISVTHSTTDKITAATIATTATTTPTTSLKNSTIKNPFLDDSRSSSSNFNFNIPELPILKQFHHLDSLLKSFSSERDLGSNQFSKYFSRSEEGNETMATRFPVRTKQTTVKTYKKDDPVFVQISTVTPEPTTKVVRQAVVLKGEVEIVAGPIKREPSTTELPKLITLLPVRSNVNMMRPLRPRPKSNVNSTITVMTRRKSKMSPEFKTMPHQKHHIVNDKNGKRWVYYSSSRFRATPADKKEKLFIVTPEPKTRTIFPGNFTNVPLYNTIESLLNLDFRNRQRNSSGTGQTRKNTSDIVDKIVRIVENVSISTADTPKLFFKENQTINLTEEVDKAKTETMNRTGPPEAGVMATKAVSSHYKFNQAGVPVLTKILNKAPSKKKPQLNDSIACNEASIKCGNGTCLPASKKCNQFIDCPDAEDEKNCTCSEHLKAQRLHRKLCDGIVDCWDFTDEYYCEWCREEFLCSNSKVCIKKDQICDGIYNCPFGDDERNCVTVSPSRDEAETFSYHHNGYLMVRKNGRWGKLCVDNFESVSLKANTGWKITDLGRTVCKALTFRDFDKVERMISVPNEGRSVGSSESERYYELAYNEVSPSQHSARDSVLSFHETNCARKEVIKVTCTDLECGLRPQATHQWSRQLPLEGHSLNSSRRSRIVGGGNAGPGSWPWQAALYREGEFQCGGTLISDSWLISAGHCFYHNQEAYWVARLGTLRTTLLLPSPYEQLRQISKVILHPQYVDNGFINDISLLRMRDPVRFTDYVRPICLPNPLTPIVDGTMCTVVGWGQLSEVGWVFPDTLQEVQLPIMSSNECRKRTIFLPLYKITDDMFCAGYDRGGRDACLGDSGGPLMCQEPDGKWILLGVTSNGYGCARSNRPGVYTKVSKYLQWVQSQMTLHPDPVTPPATETEDKLNLSTSKGFSEEEEATEKKQDSDYVIKLISMRVSNVKLSTDSGKSKDGCKGHRCPLGECLAKDKLCNGHIECSDGSDEKDCW